jgi:hypothetical protein
MAKETITVRVYTTSGFCIYKKVSTLKELQDIVKGYVEVVYDQNQAFVVNEDGLSLNLPRNFYFPHLVGNVVVADRGSELLG